MPPHTSLQYTMPSNNTTNSKSTLTTTTTSNNNNNNNNNTNSTPKPLNISTPTKPVTTRQRRATSASSYIFAPSWLTNLNNKTVPATTILSPAYVSTIEGNSTTTNETNEEGVVVVGSKNKDGLGVTTKQVRDSLVVKDSNSSLSSSTPRTSTRPKSRDFSGSLLTTLEETETNEEALKAFHGRSRSVSQANPNISSSPTSFDRNFPTLAKKKQISLSVDLPAKNVDNMWANSDIKSKLLSPTTYNHLPEDSTKLNNSNIDNEPELERRMSLVPKVENGKLDGKRTIIKQSMKRKTSRSLSMDSVARVSTTTINSGIGLGVGVGISNSNGGGGGGRTNGQSQHFRPYLRETVGSKPINIQPQRPRAASISASNNGIKKNSTTTTTTTTAAAPLRVVSGLSSRRWSIGNNPKYNWSSNHTMGKMGHFKILSEDEEDILNCDDDNNNHHHHHQVEDNKDFKDLDNLENENNNKNKNVKNDNNIEKENSELDKSDKLTTTTTTTTTKTITTTNISETRVIKDEQINDMGSSSIEYNRIDDDNLENSNSVPQSPVSASLEREEKFLRQLGWQKPYKDDDSSQWAITEEEKRLFINLVRALSGGVSINEKRVSENTSLSNGEINRAKRNWAAAITIKKQKNGDICIQNQDNLTYIRTNMDNFTFNEKTENKIENNNDVDNGVFFVM
ncbi:hypothetical protein Glove_103g56 [Diversispora epigaea]|uniref:Uncharacterized protein n=1 Tax=Diversispora epigaea TaxID=1348612 RepID=A0A397J7X3_9GLOM|nr:hypothetical protein Glove_103g56 [Diversispora epigaea]